MSAGSEQIFRAAAVERLSSPDQLEELVRITRPSDWAAALVVCLALAAALAWSVIGRIPTRVVGAGILVSDGGRVVDAVSAVGGRLASLDVRVGDRVSQGQIIAHLSQTDTDQRYRNAVEVLHEREREHAELVSAIEQELAAKTASFAAQKAGLEQVIAAAEDRAAYLKTDVKNLEATMARGFATRREIEERRAQLVAAEERTTDARNEILRLNAQKLDLAAQREHDRLASQLKVNDARRQMDELAGMLERDSRLLSPSEGRVIETKVSSGGVLAVGTPVAAIETEGKSLEAVIYVSGEQGKNVRPGMEVRIEPSMIKREEFGALIGKVSTISEFPVTPEGMAAVLHNAALVTRFSREGAPYEAVVQLERDTGAASGYRWSSGSGPPLRLTTGTLTRAEITTREQPPIDLVVPLMKRLSGIGG
jgi:HlyD family secretion protein